MTPRSLSPRIARLRRTALETGAPAVPPALGLPVEVGDFALFGAGWRDYLETMPIRFTPDSMLPGGFPAEIPSGWETRNARLVELNTTIRTRWREEREHPLAPPSRFLTERMWVGGGNHAIPGYEQILREGFPARLARIERGLAAETAPRKRDFLQAMREMTLGFLHYFERCAATLDTAAGAPENADRTAELRRLANAFRQAARRPPENFREALAVYDAVFFFIGDSPGCFDRYLEPYWRRDLVAGVIDEATAFDYLCACFIRFYSVHGKDHHWTGVVHLALGGRRADGSSAVTEFTRQCLDAAEALALIRPQIALRWAPNAPEWFLRRGAELLRGNFGSPDFSNDEIFIPALIRAGITPEAAAEYSPSGCNEVMIPGQSHMGALGGHFNLPKLLNVLFGQIVPYPGMTVPPLSELDTWDKFLDAVRQLRKSLIGSLHHWTETNDRAWTWTGGTLKISLFTDDCIARGRSMHAGGARFNGSNFDAAGVVNLGDSLAAVRRLVYLEKRLSLTGLRDILQRNWQGHEPLREEIRHRFPHFGNQCAEADEMAAAVLRETAAEFADGTPYRGGSYNLGTLGGYENAHILLAAQTLATPDGRADGEPFASGLSPVAGFDRSGPTAMLNSVRSLPFDRICTSTIVNLTLEQSLFETAAGLDGVTALLDAYLRNGGIQLQITVADHATLLAAEKNPEAYPDLMVRVSGYSARFFSLAPEVRAEVVRRTAHQV